MYIQVVREKKMLPEISTQEAFLFTFVLYTVQILEGSSKLMKQYETMFFWENQFTINRRDPNSNVGLPGRKASVLTIWPRYFLPLLWHFFLYGHGTFITT